MGKELSCENVTVNAPPPKPGSGLNVEYTLTAQDAEVERRAGSWTLLDLSITD